MMADNIIWLDFNDAPEQRDELTSDTDALRAGLLDRLEAVLHYLFPQGRIRGGKFYVGDVDGNPGKSLVVELDGPRRGLWKDFSTDEGGDIIDLWARSQGRSARSDFPRIAGEIRQWLGIAGPVGTPMRLTMTSTDVIHSFFIPVFRLKKDVVPGRYTVMWFEATKEGEYPLFCTEYCGDRHSGMIGVVQVVSGEKYLDILKEAARLEYDPAKGDKTQADFGKRVYDARGCGTCHSLDGSAKTGPTFKGLYGKTESITGGSTVTVASGFAGADGACAGAADFTVASASTSTRCPCGHGAAAPSSCRSRCMMCRVSRALKFSAFQVPASR